MGGGGREAPEGDEGRGFKVDEEAALVGEGLRFGLPHCGVVIADRRQKAAGGVMGRCGGGGGGGKYCRNVSVIQRLKETSLDFE